MSTFVITIDSQDESVWEGEGSLAAARATFARTAVDADADALDAGVASEMTLTFGTGPSTIRFTRRVGVRETGVEVPADYRGRFAVDTLARLQKAELPTTVAAALAATPRKSVTRTGTYMGSRCETTEHLFQTKSTGLRLVVSRWVDDATPANGGHPAGTVVRALMFGDGRTPDYVRLDETVTAPAAASAAS